MKTHVVVFSGGLDSTVLLDLVKRGASSEDEIIALSFDYGQTHTIELKKARHIAQTMGVKHEVVSLPGIFSGSALTGDKEIPDGEYEEPGMVDTEVVGRNLLFASVAVARVGKGGVVYLGVHSGDHYLYPDCRPDFWRSLDPVVGWAYEVKLDVPFLNFTKTDIVKLGDDFGVPLHLTYSCYRGGDIHCGTCGTCVERRQSFRDAGVRDLTVYALERVTV